jgi:hypothetical protein
MHHLIAAALAGAIGEMSAKVVPAVVDAVSDLVGVKRPRAVEEGPRIRPFASVKQARVTVEAYKGELRLDWNGKLEEMFERLADDLAGLCGDASLRHDQTARRDVTHSVLALLLPASDEVGHRKTADVELLVGSPFDRAVVLTVVVFEHNDDCVRFNVSTGSTEPGQTIAYARASGGMWDVMAEEG